MNQMTPAISATELSMIGGASDAPAQTSVGLSEGAESSEFSDLLHAENVGSELRKRLSQVIDELREQLPEEQFAVLEQWLSGGSKLPHLPDIAALETQLSRENVSPELVAALGAALTISSQQLNSKGLDQRVPQSISLSSRGMHADLRGGAVATGLPAVEGLDLESMPEGLSKQLVTGSESTAKAGDFEFAQAALAVKSALSSELPVPNGRADTVSPLSGMSGFTTASGLSDVRPTPPPLPAAVTVPPGSQGWDQAVGDRVMWMVGRQIQSATLKITPRNMGPIEIQVAVQNDQANVSFLAHQAGVREALEAAIPRLREMFSEQNMQLLNVDVSHREEGGTRDMAMLFQQQRGKGEGGDYDADGSTQDGNGEGDLSTQVDLIQGNGLVDAYV
ncbi:MAG: hypothetical protein GY934_15240 [Gammaproteobacteria bacterium]|nr:hypothetical protein [Gammaproteobacteria bacterium]